MIKYVIFDLDDTLFDYQKAKKNAISLVDRVLESSGIDVDQFWNSYSLIEPNLFRQFVNGIISRDEYRLRRYADVIEGDRENFLAFFSALNDIYMVRIQVFDWGIREGMKKSQQWADRASRKKAIALLP